MVVATWRTFYVPVTGISRCCFTESTGHSGVGGTWLLSWALGSKISWLGVGGQGVCPQAGEALLVPLPAVGTVLAEVKALPPALGSGPARHSAASADPTFNVHTERFLLTSPLPDGSLAHRG